MRTSLWLVLPLALVLAACGGGDDEAPVASSDPDPDGEKKIYTGVGTVLESPQHGPQLCLGGIATSYPPQCGGPDIEGWSWEDVDGHETANGTTWGTYVVTGHYDGARFTLTEQAAAAADTTPVPGDQPPEPDFSTPCPEPAGGWTVVDESKATQAALDETLERASAEADYAGAWVDQSINPAMDDGLDDDDELAMNDPTMMILNVRFTGDLDRHETELRELWGGSLCVSQAENTEAELREIQESLDVPGMLSSGVDVKSGALEVSVILDDGLQQQLDEQYGTGKVKVYSALTEVTS
ncbi:hypothetical protein [Phytoactinopolyspora limicola]|uniref:hypothetical protein n=1 Tax=Phytoactinopolyspora limicola TaxID=2715536 RepID=UPI00140C9553|nr:hypothetical protein [Phytoactinopolyspora limicola]